MCYFPQVMETLTRWGLGFEPKLTGVNGRILAREKMTFANGSEVADEKADWTKAFRCKCA
jgi:hypothetical protein